MDNSVNSTALNTKLTINLRDGIVEVQGSEDFVRAIYQDFKEQVVKSNADRQPPVEQIADQSNAAPPVAKEETSRRKTKARRPPNGEAAKPRQGEYKPKFKSKLDLTELPALYDEWKPINNAEKILLFAVFLRDRLNITPCTGDDIFTCFFTLKDKTKTPEAFVQAFRDTQHRTHFIQVHSMENVEITIAGNNHYAHKNKKAAAVK